VTVNDTNPVWVYCGQAAGTPASHCGQGMVFSINCPSDDSPNSFTNFKNAALAIGASLSASASAAAASATPAGAAPTDAGSPTVTAAYGGVTLPPALSGTLVTVPITLDSTSVWTTVYTSFVNSPAATPVAAEGAVHTVVVGGTSNGSPQLFFTPSHISAAPRDTVVFQFQQKNHSVIQSAFADPCRPLNANNASAPQGFNSGFHFVAANDTEFPTWNFTVEDTAPVWAYCGQTAPASHCGAGMVFAINAADNTTHDFSAFQSVAEQLNGTGSASASTPSSTGNTGSGVSLRSSSSVGVVVAIAAVFASLL